MVPSLRVRSLIILLIVIGIGGDMLLNESFRVKLAAPFAAAALIGIVWGIRTILSASTRQVDADIDMLASASANVVQDWVEDAIRAPYGVGLYLRIFAITVVIVIAPYIITLCVNSQQQRVVLLFADVAFLLWSLYQTRSWLYLAQCAQAIRSWKVTHQSRF